MKKRVYGFALLFLFASILLVNASFVSAGPVEEIQSFFGGIVDLLNPVLQYIIGDSTGIANFDSSAVFLIKLLVLVIVFAVVWAALRNVTFFSEYNWVLIVVSVAVSILATRFVGTENLLNILLPYTTLGIVISAGLPFVIWFLIINVGFSGPGNKLVRRIAWIFFAVVFLILWFSRWDDLDAASASVYPLTALVAIILMFLDGTINRIMTTFRIEKAQAGNRSELLTDLQRKINQADSDLAAGIITQKQRDTRVNGYRRQINALS